MPRVAGNSFLRPLALFFTWLVGLVLTLYFHAAGYTTPLNLTTIAGKWDGAWYHSIVEVGYQLNPGMQSNVAFFPLYPMIMGLFNHLGLPLAAAGIIVSLIAFAIALILLYQLVERRFDARVATISCALLCASPFSFFFGLTYTEALFLLFAVLTFTFLDRARYLPAAVAAGAASATRIVGIVLGLIVIFQYITAHRAKLTPQHIAKALGLELISISGLLCFMLWLKHRTGDALAFVHVQKYWPDRSQGFSGILVPFHRIQVGGHYSTPYLLALVEVMTLAFIIAGLIYTYIKISRIWALYIIGILSIVLVSSSLVSINRYAIVLFPLYVAAAHALQKQERYLLLLMPSLLLLSTFANLFVQTATFLG